MEPCPKIDMINFEIKSCNYDSTDLGEKISQFILINYQENPESYSKEINEFLKLREDAANASKDITGLNIIKRYHRQLQFLSNRFPMKSGEQCETEFSWDHLFDEREICHSDIRFEQQCILYNIGSMHSYLGCMDKRMNEEGIRVSCNHFQFAAWAFLKVRELYSSYDFTSDLNEDIMTFKLNTVLAQAQECLLEKSIMDQRKPSIQARISAKIVDYYKLSLTNCEKQEFQSVVGSKQSKELKQYCQFKIFYYTCLMFYFSALNSAEMKKIGEAVGYIQEAESKIGECIKMKYLKEFQDVIKYTNDLITSKCKALKKENDFVYNEKIVVANELPEIKAASLANPLAINFENDPEIATQDIFIRLVSMQAHELSSLYSEEKAKILRQINEQVEEKNSNLVQFTDALQINELQLKEMDNFNLPKELIECCAEINVKEPSIRQDLVKSMKKIVDSSVQARSLLDEIELLFEAEDKEYRQSPDYSSDSSSDDENLPIKPRKKRMNQLLDRYDILIKNHDEANKSNGSLRDAISQVLSDLQILALPISELTEKLPKVELELCENESKEIRDQLLTLLAKLDEMKSQRAHLLFRIQRALQDDDITKIIASRQNEIADINEFFREELKKHDQLFTFINQNLSAQENILRALADANASFALERQRIQQACKNRNDHVKNLINSYKSINELIDKANKGVVFYEKLIDPLQNLLKDVKDFCTVQKKEREKFSDKNNANMHPIVQDFVPMINPYRKETTNKSNIKQEPVTDRPRLKDFLPIMKPETWGQNKQKPNFPNDKNQQFPTIDPNINQFNNLNYATNFVNNNRQQFSSQSTNPSAKKGPISNPALYFNTNMGSKMNEINNFTNNPVQDKLLQDQLAKEQEIEMKRKQLEQQELQLKYMQQQFELQQKQQLEKQKQDQLFYLRQQQIQQQNKEQNYWNQQNLNPNFQSNIVNGNGPASVNKNVSAQYQNGPQLPMNNHIPIPQQPNTYGNVQAPNDVNKNVSSQYQNGTQLPMNSIPQQSNTYGNVQAPNDVNKNVSAQYQNGTQLPLNNHIPIPQQQIQNSSLQNLNKNNNFPNIFEELKPDSVYKPGYLSQIKFDSIRPILNQSNITNDTINSFSNQKQIFNQQTQNGSVQFNLTPQNFIQTSNEPVKPIASIQSSSSKTTTTIDDLFDIFSSSNFSIQPALEPIKSNTIQPDKEKGKTDCMKINEQVTQPTEPQTNEPEIEISKIKISNEIEMNTSAQQSTGFNLLQTENRMEKFASEVNKFEHHVNLLNDKTLSYGTVLDKEWKELNDHQDKTSSKMTISIARLNPQRNRYQDLLPFDQTRICLQNKQNDYINANYLTQLNQDLDPLHKQPNFLVTQLPLKDFSDFWSMVIQEQCEILINICRDNELNENLYFPMVKQNVLTIGGISLQLQSQKESNFSIQRVFTVHKDSVTRTVLMLQFKWDNCKSMASVTGIAQNEMPENTANFLKFVKECENFYIKEQRNRSKPILVHCMNGVSRSAVFILLYSLIQIVDTICLSDLLSTQFSTDLVLKSINQMRSKRKYMIQSTYHLKYSYDAILYYMKDILIKQGVFASNEINFERRNSNLETSICSDQSVASIQSSRDEKNSVMLSVNDIIDPTKFNLELDETKRKTSKKDFSNIMEKKIIENDPFGWLDPLK